MAKKKTGSVVDTDRYEYDKIRVRDKSGKIRHSANNGDAIAKAMLVHLASGGTIEQVIRANKLKVEAKATNPGLLRMRVGVSLRAIVKGGEPVQIGKQSVKSLKQAIVVPKVEDLAPRKSKASKRAASARKADKAKKSAPRKRAKKAEAAATEAAAV